MQDYIDIIDQEGLLTNKQDDILDKSASKEATKTAINAGQISSTSALVVKPKVVLAKLPEENKDGWLALEQNMNKESLQKKEREVSPPPAMTLKKAESMPV